MSDNDTIKRRDAEALIYDLLDGEPAKDKWSDVGTRIADIPSAPHEMTAREFFEEYQRMRLTVDGCGDCPIMGIDTCAGFPCRYRAYLNPDKAVAIVEKWAREHPEKKRKTYAEDFNEKFPKALWCEWEARPVVCKEELYDDKGKCEGDCFACWNEEM